MTAVTLESVGTGKRREMAETASRKEKSELQKPNEKAYQEKIEAEVKAIETLRSKVRELQECFNQIAGGRNEYIRKKEEGRARLDALQGTIDELEKKRKDLQDKINAKEKQGAEIKQSASEMKKKLGFTNSGDIDKRIAELENTMMTTTLTLKEEKTMLEDIRKLKSSKPFLTKYAALEQSATLFEDSSIVPLKTALAQVRTKLLEVRSEKRVEYSKFKELMEERQTATAPGRVLMEEKEELLRRIDEHYQKRNAIQDERNREISRYQQHLRQVKRERDEKMREERLRRQLENERAQLEMDLDRVENELPYEAECTLLSQTIQYVEQLMAQPSVPQVKEEEETKIVAPEGQGKALLPKNQREEKFYFAPKQKQGKKTHAEKERKKKGLTFDVGTLSYFEQCGVAAPVTTEDLSACLEKLSKKLSDYKGQQTDKAERVEERKAEILMKIQNVEKRIAEQLKKDPDARGQALKNGVNQDTQSDEGDE